MRSLRLASALSMACAAAATAYAQTPAPSEPQPVLGVADGNASPYGPMLPRNRPLDVRGVQVVCTGVDSDSRDDPRWAAFPMKLEFAAANGSYLAFAQVSVKGAKGKDVVSVRCPGAWLLLGLPPGEYSATVSVPRLPDQTVMFSVPRTGQKSMVVRFPLAAGGTVSQNGAPAL